MDGTGSVLYTRAVFAPVSSPHSAVAGCRVTEALHVVGLRVEGAAWGNCK